MHRQKIDPGYEKNRMPAVRQNKSPSSGNSKISCAIQFPQTGRATASTVAKIIAREKNPPNNLEV